MKRTGLYKRGYDCAIQAIDNPKNDLQKLFEASYHALDQDDFDKGWQEACLEKGAIAPDY